MRTKKILNIRPASATIRVMTIPSPTRRAFIKACAALSAAAILPVAAAEVRSLSILNVHTNERVDVVYKRGDSYDAQGLSRINHVLRDHRRNEAIEINPQTLDRLYEVGQKAKARYPHIDLVYHVNSGYRAPETNEMLRKGGGHREGGQAKLSRHMFGDAIDFRIPGVPLTVLRDIAVCSGSGGIGYYQISGFIHIDSDRTRHWPGTWAPNRRACEAS